MARKRGWGQSRRRRRTTLTLPDARVPVLLTWDELHRTHSGHVHGRLHFAFGDRALPYMGYFGPTDVCFHAWAEELRQMTAALSRPNRYIYDEGEQGQPAFEFVRGGEEVLVSIIDSQLSDGLADRHWQRVRCSWNELCEETSKFLKWYDQQHQQDWPGLSRPSQDHHG